MEPQLRADSELAALADLNGAIPAPGPFPFPFPLWRAVSGTYRNADPADLGTIIELRVDVDGTRPQYRLSGDIYRKFTFLGISFTLFVESFVVDSPTISGTGFERTISGPVTIYGKPERVGESVEVHIPRVRIFQPAAVACVNWKVDGATTAVYACPKISDYQRTASLEIDRFPGTTFPPQLDPTITPSPPGLPATVSVREVFTRSGLDLTVTDDDVLNDPDGPDLGENWSEAELHDLMETRFDSFADSLQWRMYGVVVPRFGDPNYEAGYYGVMFDWGGYQPGDTFLRQGCAIAEDAIRGRSVGTLYSTVAGQNRLLLQTFLHEVGHTWNLPHSWERGNAPSSASMSFMNYPWLYTGGTGGETAFWTDFGWQFDDVELRWMRHADRNDVIFGARDWIGNNLTRLLDPLMTPVAGLRIELAAAPVVEMSEPVFCELTLTNGTAGAVALPADLSPEAGSVAVYLQQPDGQVVEHRPPARRLVASDDIVPLAPGEARTVTIGLSFAATGPALTEPGPYRVRAVVSPKPGVTLPSAPVGIRVAVPASRAEEELTELVRRREVAQFLYFGGNATRRGVADLLAAAVNEFAVSSPRTILHMRTSLGIDAMRDTKSTGVHEDRRVVTHRPGDPVAAAEHLNAAVRLRDAARLAGGDARAAGLAVRLAQAFEQRDEPDRAATAAEQAARLRGAAGSTSNAADGNRAQAAKKTLH